MLVSGSAQFLEAAPGWWLLIAPLAAFGLLGVLLFGYTFLFSVYRLQAAGKPAFVLDSQGLTDQASWLSAGRLRWEDIRALREAGTGPRRALAILPEDLDSFLARQSTLRRRLMSLNLRFSGAPVVVVWAYLPTRPGEMRSLVSQAAGPGAPVFRGAPETPDTAPGTRFPTALRWAAAFGLTLFFYAVAALLTLGGGVLCWLAGEALLGTGSVEWGVAVAVPAGVLGVLLVALALLIVARLMERVIRILTGRAPVAWGN